MKQLMRLLTIALAVVMALGLIACMSAMAFAANAGSYSFDVSKSEDGKTLYATLYAHDYIGLASGTVTVTYSGVKFDHASTGAEAKAVNDSLDNSFTADVNNTQAGKVIYGFVDPETGIKELNDALYAAGLEEYMAAKQAALDEWAKSAGIN